MRVWCRAPEGAGVEGLGGVGEGSLEKVMCKGHLRGKEELAKGRCWGAWVHVKVGTKEFLHLEEAASSRVKKPEITGASLRTVKQTSSRLRWL